MTFFEVFLFFYFPLKKIASHSLESLFLAVSHVFIRGVLSLYRFIINNASLAPPSCLFMTQNNPGPDDALAPNNKTKKTA